MSSRDDNTLLHSWRAGDREAGNELFGRYFKQLYRFFASKLDLDAEDLVQETLLACVKGEHRLGPDSSFRGYLYGIAWNLLRERLRRKARRPTLDFSVERLVDLTPTPSSMFRRQDRERRLINSLRGLSVEDQVLVELYYSQGLKSREVAEVLEIPHPTARGRIRRAAGRLREELEKSEGLPISEEQLSESFRQLNTDAQADAS